jgi:hypothetical protein
MLGRARAAALARQTIAPQLSIARMVSEQVGSNNYYSTITVGFHSFALVLIVQQCEVVSGYSTSLLLA